MTRKIGERKKKCTSKMGFVFFNAWRHVRFIHFPTVGCLEAEDQDNSVKCQCLAHVKKKQNRGKAIHLFVWELREYLTKQHSRGEWFLLPTPEAEQSRSAFTLHPSQRRGGCRLHSAEDGNSHCFIHYETISNHNCNLQYMSKLQNNFY